MRGRLDRARRPPPRQSRRPRPRQHRRDLGDLLERPGDERGICLYLCHADPGDAARDPARPVGGDVPQGLLVEHEPDGADRRPGAADTEQLAIGGYYGTRGYTLDDGSVDAGLVLRDELRLPTSRCSARSGSRRRASARSTTSSRPMPSSTSATATITTSMPCRASRRTPTHPGRPRARHRLHAGPQHPSRRARRRRPHQRTRNRPRNRHRPRTGEYLVLRASQTRGPPCPSAGSVPVCPPVDGIVAGSTGRSETSCGSARPISPALIMG